MSEEKTAESQPLARQFIEVDVRYARIVTPPELAKAYAATHAPCSSVIRVQSNAAVLAQSRRDGGLWYRFALFQYGKAILATVFVRTEGAVHVLVLDLAAAPIRELLREARTEGHLYVMLTAVDGDARLMHVADAQWRPTSPQLPSLRVLSLKLPARALPSKAPNSCKSIFESCVVS